MNSIKKLSDNKLLDLLENPETEITKGNEIIYLELIAEYGRRERNNLNGRIH